ncbi:hypothetical protein Hanom_Chr01g00059281 [Helianthus anomalus]
METPINSQSVEIFSKIMNTFPLLWLINCLCLLREFKRQLASLISSSLHQSSNLNHPLVCFSVTLLLLRRSPISSRIANASIVLRCFI